MSGQALFSHVSRICGLCPRIVDIGHLWLLSYVFDARVEPKKHALICGIAADGRRCAA